MSEAPSPLEDLLLLRKKEREDEQANLTRELTRKVEVALGDRVAEALRLSHPSEWEINHTTALRRFHFRRGEFHLVVNAVPGAPRVDVELRHADQRFESLAKKTGINDLSEDWFLNSLEMLATQILARLQNPKNFV